MCKTRILSLVMALLMLCPLVGAQELSYEQRLEQASQYLAQQRHEEALFALELAEALKGPSRELHLLRLQAYQGLGKGSEALATLDEVIRLEPANPQHYLQKAELLLSGGQPAEAQAAVMRAVVASGGDDAFASQHAADHAPMLWQLAAYNVEQRAYEEAAKLFAYHPPAAGELPAYDRLQRVLGGAKRSYNIHPGVDEEQFQRLIAEDGLKLKPASLNLVFDMANLYDELFRYQQALHERGADLPGLEPLSEGVPASMPMDMETFYQSVSYYSLSPDAGKLFMIMESVPLVMDLATQRVLAIVPGPTISADYHERYYQRLAEVLEDRGLSWSPDGNWIALCFPEKMLNRMQVGFNAIVMDLMKGEARLLDPDLPVDAKLRSPEAAEGFPLRAAFDQAEPLLYYHAFGVNAAGGRFDELRSYDLRTGETQHIANTDPASLTADPALWVTEEGLLLSYVPSSLAAGRGIERYGFDGSHRQLAVPKVDDPQHAIRIIHIPGLAEGQGLLHAQRSYEAKFGLMQTYQLFRMDEQADKVFGQVLAIAPDKPAEERLVSAALGPQDSIELEWLHSEELGSLLLPNSAALSPDGRYLLLASGRKEPALYILDIERWVLGRVEEEASQLEEGRLFAMESMMSRNRLPGLRWLDQNRIMIRHGEQMRLYELDFAD